MEEKLDLILTTLTEMKTDISTLKQDVKFLKDDVSTLKQDVNILKDELSVLKQDVTILKDEVYKLKNNYNYLTSLIHSIQEVLIRLNKVVTVMEKTHSEKIQVLLDQHTDCVRRHVSIASDLIDIDNTFSKHDARLYSLEHTN